MQTRPSGREPQRALSPETTKALVNKGDLSCLLWEDLQNGSRPPARARGSLTLDEGDVVIEFPRDLSKESVDDLADYLETFMKRARREARPKEDDGNDEGPPTEAASAPAIYEACLVQGFDSISANGLKRLLTVRGEVSPSLRFEEGLCFLKAIPFRDCHSLGWGRPLHANNLAASRAEITTARVRLCSLDALCNISSGRSIHRFGVR